MVKIHKTAKNLSGHLCKTFVKRRDIYVCCSYIWRKVMCKKCLKLKK